MINITLFPTATGEYLDNIGKEYGLCRNIESDENFRNRISNAIMGSVLSPIPFTFMEVEDKEIKLHKAISKICECGKEKHGFASHSNWCNAKEKV